jgi:Spy/CpxP family protein refolding chaperone
MKMRSWRAAVALALAVTAVTTAITVATAVAGGDAARDGKRAGHGARLQQELGLTDDQFQALREIHRRHGEAQKQHGQGLGQARNDLRRLVLSGADDATVQAKQAEIQQLMGQMLQARVDALREIGPLLTAEQREKYAAMAEKFGPGGRHHHRRGGPRAPSTQG